VIASKFGNLRAPDGSPTSDGRPEHVKACCERSLKRLETDVIDLYYIHRVDPTVPIEDTVGAMSEVLRQGKVRHLGICKAGAATIRRAHATHPLSAVQIEYSLWTREVEAEILPLCEELGIGFVAYSPLRRGFLTGKVAVAALRAGDARPQHAAVSGRQSVPKPCAGRGAEGACRGREPAPRRSLRSPGFCPARLISCRSPAPAIATGSRKMPPPCR
jgi:aryl-alcohol dehydrogenase-like predicted oxidoreductase